MRELHKHNIFDTHWMIGIILMLMTATHSDCLD